MSRYFELVRYSITRGSGSDRAPGSSCTIQVHVFLKTRLEFYLRRSMRSRRANARAIRMARGKNEREMKVVDAAQWKRPSIVGQSAPRAVDKDRHWSECTRIRSVNNVDRYKWTRTHVIFTSPSVDAVSSDL